MSYTPDVRSFPKSNEIKLTMVLYISFSCPFYALSPIKVGATTLTILVVPDQVTIISIRLKTN